MSNRDYKFALFVISESSHWPSALTAPRCHPTHLCQWDCQCQCGEGARRLARGPNLKPQAGAPPPHPQRAAAILVAAFGGYTRRHLRRLYWIPESEAHERLKYTGFANTTEIWMARFGLIIVSVAVAWGLTPCPVLSSSSYALPDVFTTWVQGNPGSNQDHGIQFQDINGDGLVDMLYGLDNNDDHTIFECVYLNSGFSWALQNVSSRDCTATATVQVRHVEFSFKKHTVGQFKDSVAADLGLDTKKVIVRNKRGVQQGSARLMSDLFPSGFVVEISPVTGPSSEKQSTVETYSCP
jgi:hypothetical protein